MNKIAENPIIRLEGVNKSYDVGGSPLQVLRDVSLQIFKGEYISLMGPSGSGKSTLLNMLGLLDRPDSGEYFLDQQLTFSLKEEQRAQLRARYIGFVFQSFHLLPRLTAAENIALPLILSGVLPPIRAKAVAQVLNQLHLDDRQHHLPRELSGGQQQRVAIARALVTKPKILLADEPTGNLDQTSGKEVMALLENLNAEGITLIMVTHDQALGNRATRKLTMLDGAIVNDERSPKG